MSRFASRKPGNSARSKHLPTVFAVLSVLFLLFACGPTPPREGTPAFHWAAARETYGAGDYMKTIDHLDRVLETDNEYTARALPWTLLLTSGLASGYIELADKYQAGAKFHKDAPGNFYKYVGTYRSFANRMTLHFADTFAAFGKTKDESVQLAFAFPRGSAAPVLQLATVAKGNLLPAAAAETAEKRALERGILLATVRAAGAPEDPAKAEQTLKSNEGKVPRATFLLAMANTLYEESKLYARGKMNDSEKRKILCQRALDVIKLLPESFDTKDLETSIRLVMDERPT
jgi:hypothetical protein